MLKDYSKKIQKIAPRPSFFFPLMSMLLSGAIFAASVAGALAASLENEPQFIRTGTLSFSKEYILAKDLSHITFKIKNHNPRTVSQIFGWVYRTPTVKPDETSAPKMILVNNPHRGGLLVKGGPHRPGTVAEWRFMLDREMLEASNKDLFTLRVSPKGVFFMRMEPPPDRSEDQKKKKQAALIKHGTIKPGFPELP